MGPKLNSQPLSVQQQIRAGAGLQSSSTAGVQDAVPSLLTCLDQLAAVKGQPGLEQARN